MKLCEDRPAETRVEVDPDLHAVVEFMQRTVPAGRLVATAANVAAVAPLLWGRYQPEAVQALRLALDPIAVVAGRPGASSE